MTCLLGFEQGVDVFFFGVKGVDDVLAGRGGALRSRQGRRYVLAGRGAGC